MKRASSRVCSLRVQEVEELRGSSYVLDSLWHSKGYEEMDMVAPAYSHSRQKAGGRVALCLKLVWAIRLVVGQPKLQSQKNVKEYKLKIYNELCCTITGERAIWVSILILHFPLCSLGHAGGGNHTPKLRVFSGPAAELASEHPA